VIALAGVTISGIWLYLHIRPRLEPTPERLESRAPSPESRAQSPESRAQSPGPQAGSLSIGPDTRLLIVAPHPDDEILGAGGLIQRARAVDAILHVVYLTDGEGYPVGVKAERRHGKILTPADYRAYGRQREDEARTALRDLGYSAWSLTFLGFPNGGLHRLMTTYWSDHNKAYRSRYTRLNRPRAAEAFIPDTEYRGENLTQELAEIIGAFKPTVILVTRAEDQHVDHCAAWFFVADALNDVERVHPQFRTDLVTYIVHYNSWPFDHPGQAMPPPDDLDSGVSGWINVPLTPEQVMLKQAALHRYKSQMDVTPWFLDGFARSNEVFSRPAPPRIMLPVSQSPCDDFIEH
jgi:LmbE family N-acetylglucosaminyl deacetylase